MTDQRQAGATRSAERTITLTDAVVAIAMTLLVLPLVDLAPEVAAKGWGFLLQERLGVLLGFVLSFLVVFVFWLAHEHAFASVCEVGPVLRVLNLIWLLLVAFLPFPTAVVGDAATTTTTPVYIGTMFALSAVTSSISQVCARSALVSREAWRSALTWATPAVFGVCALVSTVNADAGLFGLLLLVAVRAAEVVTPHVLPTVSAGTRDATALKSGSHA